MSIYIDRKYLLLASPKLINFKQKNQDLYNFKCPYCNDSKKKSSKCRGYIYKKSTNYFYRCFNCDTGTTFYKFLDFVDPFLAKEYQLERFTNGDDKQHNYTKPTFVHKKPVFTKRIDINLPSISSLEDTHYAKQYVLNRKIPKGFHKDLYFAKDFRQFVLEIKPDYDKTLIDNDPRLIIPFRNEEGNLVAFQGRALGKNDLRYITVKLNDDIKIFGLDRINKKERIFVVEGPIDALFIKNAVATADANLSVVGKLFDKENLVLVPDNECRNKNIVDNIERFIKEGFSVCLFPEYIKQKDINDMILSGMTKPQIQKIIDENTFSGMRATIEFNNWKKI